MNAHSRSAKSLNPSKGKPHSRSQPEETEAGKIALGVGIVNIVAQAVLRTIPTRGSYVVASAALGTLPILLLIPAIVGAEESRGFGKHLVLVLWPWLLVFLPLLFCRKAASLLAICEQRVLALTSAPAWRVFRRGWRRELSFRKQASSSALIAAIGSTAGFIFAYLGGTPLLLALLGALALLLASFFGGLGFVVAASSPLLTARVSRMPLELDPLEPAQTLELREIARAFSLIVLYGSAIGVVLSMPLLYLAASYGATSLRILLYIAIAPAWLTVLVVLVRSQVHLARSIRVQRHATIQILTKKIRYSFATITDDAEADVAHLNELYTLLRAAHRSGRLSFDFRTGYQAFLSLLLVLAPVIIEILVAELRP